MSANAAATDVVRLVLKERAESHLVLCVPHTDYALHLVLAPGTTLSTPIGKRASGVIEARALRIHATAGGGQFIEPVEGAPRILTGRVQTVDREERRVLVKAAVPMWLVLRDGQDLDVIEEGGLVTGYVESGTTFRPA